MSTRELDLDGLETAARHGYVRDYEDEMLALIERVRMAEAALEDISLMAHTGHVSVIIDRFNEWDRSRR